MPYASRALSRFGSCDLRGFKVTASSREAAAADDRLVAREATQCHLGHDSLTYSAETGDAVTSATGPRSPASLADLALSQQVDWVKPEDRCNPFDTLKCEIALSALDTAHVGAVYAELVRERFLAEIVAEPVEPEVSSDDSL